MKFLGWEPEDVTVVSGDVYAPHFSVEYLLTDQQHDTWGGIWLAPNGEMGSFILNLNCKQTFDGIRLVNTHNAGHRDRATKTFR